MNLSKKKSKQKYRKKNLFLAMTVLRYVEACLYLTEYYIESADFTVFRLPFSVYTLDWNHDLYIWNKNVLHV